MDIVDCTTAESFNEDGAIARHGDAECDFEPSAICRFYAAPDETLRFRRGRFAHYSGASLSTASGGSSGGSGGSSGGSGGSSGDAKFGRFEDSFSELMRRPLGALPSGHFLILSEVFGETPDAAAVLQNDG